MAMLNNQRVQSIGVTLAIDYLHHSIMYNYVMFVFSFLVIVTWIHDLGRTKQDFCSLIRHAPFRLDGWV